MVARWLGAFGPGTVADLTWWLGSSVAGVRRAFADVGAIEVDLDGEVGYGRHRRHRSGRAMGGCSRPSTRPPWAGRVATGTSAPTRISCSTPTNAGPTVWWDGRVVGGWRQHETGDVEPQLLEDIGADGRAAIEKEAVGLTRWFAGTRVLPRFPSPLSKTMPSATSP